MSRTTVEIDHTCSRGVAKSRIENFLTENEYKPQTIKKAGVIWFKNIGKTSHLKCVQIEYGDKKLTLYAWIAGSDGYGNYSEEELKGIKTAGAKNDMRKLVKKIQEMFA